MDPLSVGSSVASLVQLATSVISYLNEVRSSSAERQKCLIEVSNCLPLLTSLRFRVESSNSTDPWFVSVRSLALADGPFDQFKKALETLSTKLRLKSTKIGQLSSATSWPFDKKEIEIILARLERLKSSIQLALENDAFELSKAIQEDTKHIKEDVSEIHGVFQHQDREEILEWLSSTDYATQLMDVAQRREPGTGEWFRNHEMFEKWLNAEHEPSTGRAEKTLFCPGQPGTGKTVLASAVVEWLWEDYGKEAVGVAFLFCNYKRREEQTVTHYLSNILKQLLQNQVRLPDSVEDLYKKNHEKRMTPSTAELCEVLMNVVGIHEKVYLVVDGLDECEGGHATGVNLLSKLFQLQNGHDVRIFATSRSVPDIVNSFQDCLSLEVSAFQDDIRKYLTTHMSRLPRIVRKDSNLQEQIKDTITQAAQGMFLLARLWFEFLMNKRSMAAIKSALSTLRSGPEALSKAYDTALERIQSQSKEDCQLAKSAIGWITHAQRPLTSIELRHALAVEDSDSRDLDDETLIEIEDILDVCAGLVVVNKANDVVSLVHYTTQEYFENVRRDWTRYADQEMTRVCMRYVAYDIFRNHSEDYSFTKSPFAKYKLLEYAARNWGYHARNCTTSALLDVEERGRIFNEVVEFLCCEDRWSMAYDFIEQEVLFRKRFSVRNTSTFGSKIGCHLAAFFGLTEVLEHLVRTCGGDPDSQDHLEMTPLHWAACGDESLAIEILCDQFKADIERKTLSGYTPLEMATRFSNLSAAETLLMKSSLVDNITLDIAVRTGSIPLMELFLKHAPAPVDLLEALLNHLEYSFDEEFWSIICKSERVDPNWREKHNLSEILWNCIFEQNEAGFKVFFEYANSDVADDWSCNPAVLAATFGSPDIISRVLTFQAASAIERDKSGRTPLTYAMKYGHLDSVLFLIQEYDTELMTMDVGLTLFEGRYDMILHKEKYLGIRNKETDDQYPSSAYAGILPIDVPDSLGRTPLFYAVHSQNTIVSQLLRSYPQINVNHRDSFGRTALFYAARRGHFVRVMKLVQIHGAEIDIKDHYGWTPLGFAGNLETVEILLQLGVKEVNDVVPADMQHYGDGEHEEKLPSALWRPLVRAVAEDKPECWRMLIERGATWPKDTVLDLSEYRKVIEADHTFNLRLLDSFAMGLDEFNGDVQLDPDYYNDCENIRREPVSARDFRNHDAISSRRGSVVFNNGIPKRCWFESTLGWLPLATNHF